MMQKMKQIQMTAHVSKGTYIRTIVDDLGEKSWGVVHMLLCLHRSKVGHYPSEKMVTIEQLEEKLQQAKAEGVEPSTYLDDVVTANGYSAGRFTCY